MFFKNWEDCGRVSDCEELVGSYSQEMIGLNLSGQPIIKKSKLLPLCRGEHYLKRSKS